MCSQTVRTLRNCPMPRKRSYGRRKIVSCAGKQLQFATLAWRWQANNFGFIHWANPTGTSAKTVTTQCSAQVVQTLFASIIARLAAPSSVRGAQVQLPEDDSYVLPDPLPGRDRDCLSQQRTTGPGQNASQIRPDPDSGAVLRQPTTAPTPANGGHRLATPCPPLSNTPGPVLPQEQSVPSPPWQDGHHQGVQQRSEEGAVRLSDARTWPGQWQHPFVRQVRRKHQKRPISQANVQPQQRSVILDLAPCCRCVGA